ncbi:hypothetical protein ES703_28152 [subsurface metagenome]
MNRKRKNLRRGFARLTLVLSLIAAVTGAIIGLISVPYSSFNPYLYEIQHGSPPPSPSAWTYASYSSAGLTIGFSSVWVLYFFIGYVIMPVIRFIKSGFETK